MAAGVLGLTFKSSPVLTSPGCDGVGSSENFGPWMEVLRDHLVGIFE